MTTSPSANDRYQAATFNRMTPAKRKAMRAMVNYGALEKRADLWLGRENFIARWNTVLWLVAKDYATVVIRADSENRRFLELTRKGQEMMAAVDMVRELGGMAVAQAWDGIFREAAE